MNAESSSQDPVIAATIQDAGHDEAEHHDHVQHAFDSPEEVAHAKLHAKENIVWFIGFFSLILCAVANYELYGTTNMVLVFVLAAARCLLIAFFMNYLFSSFSLIHRTFIFTIVFFGGMVFLSWWDSELRGIGDPIKDRIHVAPNSSHVP